MRIFHVILISLSSLSWVWAADGSGGRASLEGLRIHNQISFWKEEAKSFVRFDPQSLYDLIDGGAPEYNEKGLKTGFFQRLKGPDSMILEIYVEDFGAKENARAMFDIRRSEQREPLRLDNKDTLVCTVKLTGAYATYTTMDKFYFELVLTGNQNQKKVLAEMDKILAYYKKQIRGKT